MLKINPVRTFAVAAALTLSASALAQGASHKQQKMFLTEKAVKMSTIPHDEFVPQVKITSPTEAKSVTRAHSTNPDFDNAVNYYNEKMDMIQRSSVTYDTYSKLEQRMYKMEKNIDNAYIECEAYGDIMIVPKWYYRFYPYWNDKLVNFDIEDLRTRTTNDMASLHNLKDKVEYIIEEANGETTHKEPQKTEYDVDAIAKKHLGMSYEEFAEKYKAELEYCKYVTLADINNMNETQAYVYGRAKSYAKEMLNTTIIEAHNVNWDIGERKVDETTKATEGMYSVTDFECDGITESGLSAIESGITYKSFEEALVNRYKELNGELSGFSEITTNSSSKKTRKVFVDGKILIHKPDGTVDNLNGYRIK